jgi:A/G-specific adenine glycosylase
MEPEWISSVRVELGDWYAVNRRDLPWRREINAYRVLVSEMMLIQTTVVAVIPFFERFLERFPDAHTLAAATEDEVLKEWEGLGYYRRARQLQAAAKIVVRDHDGVIPPDPQAVRALPGVGRYIAGAILSFAFDRQAPILEANSQRVVARLLAVQADLTRSETQHLLWSAADSLVPERGAGNFNQALMDLGASICVPRSPACMICPLSRLCKARQAGMQDRVPVIVPRPSPVIVTEACAIVASEGLVLLVQRTEGGLWSKFWEFPTINLSGADPAGRCPGHRISLEDGVTQSTGIRAEVGPELKTISYSVTKHRVTLRVHLARKLGGEIRPGPGFMSARWVATRELGALTLSSPARKLADWIIQHPDRLSWTSGP